MRVPEPRAVVGRVASLVYGTERLPLRLYGVTGTNGKTTTAYLVNSALVALGHTTGLIGTVETRIGDERIKSVRTTPEATVLHALLAVMAERGVDSCVMEVSSHALSQHRVDGVVYDVALFTNLSQDHLDFHPTMRDYFEAKASLFTPERSRRGIVCVDDEWGRELAQTASVPVTTVTSVPDVDADWRLEPGAAPAELTLTDGATSLHLRSALPGDFNRVNTAMAALALMAAGLSPRDVEHALWQDPHVPGRMQRVAVDVPEGAARPGPACPTWWWTTRTPPMRWRRRCAPFGRRPGAAWWSSSVPAATATAASGRRWGAPRPTMPTWSSSPTTTRAPRTPP